MKKNRFICYAIFLLTVLDIGFTSLGLRLGLIEEANPIINYFFELSMIITGFFVLLYVGMVLIFLNRASSRISWLPNTLIGLTFVKVFILLLHIEWIMIYYIPS